MKVLLLDGAGFSPPYDFSLVRGLEAAGASVKLVMPDSVRAQWESPDLLPTANPSGLLRRFRQVSKAAGYVGQLHRVRQIVNTWRPDVVHVQWLPLPLADNPFLYLLKGRVPLVHTMHNTSLFHGSTGGIQGWGLRSALGCFDRVVVHSEYSRRSAIEAGTVGADVLRVIPHGAFDYYRQLATRSAAGASRGPVRLLFAGSIKHYKGLDVLVESLSTLAERSPVGSWELIVAGHPSMPMTSLQEAVAGMGLESHVQWRLRHQTERELGQLLVDSDIVVLPYREIDQSGVLLAAVGVGRAAVATTVGAFPELLVHQQHGLLVPPGDPVALGAALARLVVDRELRTYCQQQMEQLSGEALSWSSIGRATLDMYQELVLT